MEEDPMHTLTTPTTTRRTARRPWALALLALATLTALPDAARASDGPRVDIVTVSPQTVGESLVLDGTLEAVQQSTLAAQASGRIVQLSVKAGDRVRAGQVLAIIDDRETSAGVQGAQAAVAQAEAQARNAEAHLKRTRELRAQGFVSQAALDTAQAQADAARAALAQARAGQSQSLLAQGFTRLTAPYEGFVLATHAQAGDLATPGRPILTLYAPQPLRATVQVPASRAALAQSARRIEVRLPDGRWVRPSAQTRLPGADPVAQTIEWRLALDPADVAAQLPGQAVKVRFVAEGSGPQRLLVPAQALLRRGELTAVYLVAPAGSPSGFVLRAVRVGADHGDAGVEILSGLQAGDRIALDPVRAGLAGAQPAQR
jgi:RND family efflux transporter MFP subunit